MSKYPGMIFLLLIASSGYGYCADDSLTATQQAIQGNLISYHQAMTSGDVGQVEKYVVADDSFAMVEGKHTNWGWADYRDNHLTPELAGLSKVEFHLEFKSVHVSGDMAYASFLFRISPKGDPGKDYGSGRATAILVHGPRGWLIQHLHIS